MDVVIIADVFSSDINPALKLEFVFKLYLISQSLAKIEHIFLGRSTEKGERNCSTNCCTLRLIYFTNALKFDVEYFIGYRITYSQRDVRANIYQPSEYTNGRNILEIFLISSRKRLLFL